MLLVFRPFVVAAVSIERDDVRGGIGIGRLQAAMQGDVYLARRFFRRARARNVYMADRAQTDVGADFAELGLLERMQIRGVRGSPVCWQGIV